MPRFDFKCKCGWEDEVFVPYDTKEVQCGSRRCTDKAERTTSIYKTNWVMPDNTGAQKEG